MDYDQQLKNYIQNNLGIKNYTIKFKEKGAIPLFHHAIKKEKNKVNIGSAGGMTRLSTGYTFLNIQEHSRFIIKNIEKIENKKNFHIGKKYEFLDNIFFKVIRKILKNAKYFFRMFKSQPNIIIKF